ncbi:MAG: hypothetical protein A3B25_00465 [Candidatus Ryanbacteria bacterium RIFCSPLOWO2_01_FULL_48_26]|uniref:Bis(5'-nucleosyl)-tetraphosphatase [asymmetrical] n=1 Tax=Candidatus Ryanbacteria bacterium RIFCSPLOWO2_01_FULL_48_26 TaxID=1802126 RepID=A0A1G2GTN0_9BACT|nr:MAG: hypothetical protein A3B25_00465 [Candidatus Ryanbacteria bacterium RIFCSPLOWO2_01_FULL_48_26]
MKKEISAGIIVFRRTQEGPKFLLLYHGHNYWNFAKGKIEKEEDSLAAALREVREETGLANQDIRLIKDFKAHERFYFKRQGQQVFKIVIFYLAETRTVDIKVSSEHEGYGWFLIRDAKNILGKYKDSQRVFRQAYEFLRTRARRPNA